jgi:two-component system sensor histidine kinase/response regulator
MILDRQAALERIDHDQELYAEICEIFRDEVPKIISLLKEANDRGDNSLATRCAHTLKSAAANIGAVDLCESARSAENAFRAGVHGNIHTLISEIDENVSHVLDALNQVFATPD